MTEKNKNAALIKEAKERFEKAGSWWSENHQRMKDAIRFRSLEQWPSDVKRDRENPSQEGGSRPCPVLDKTNQYIRRIVNEQRLNRPSFKFRPVDDAADVKVASVLDGLGRQIQDASDAESAYSTAGESAVTGGFGFWRLLTDYTDPESFDQDIYIERISNVFSVLLGPHVEPDGSDVRYGFIYEDLPKEVFKATYPKESPNDWDSAINGSDGWYGSDYCRIAEYYRIVETRTNMVLLDTGETMDKDEYDKNSVAAKAAGIPVPAVIKDRVNVSKKVEWYKLTADTVLEKREVLGSYIPIVEVIGNEIVLEDGKRRLSGAIESMMDAQRLHNYAHAGFIEHVALSPRAPWVAEESQVADYEDDYAVANRKNIVLLKYKSTSSETGQPIPPPQRLPPPGVPAGWQQVLANTEHGIEAAVGMYGASIGGPARERSGVALEQQQQQGDIGTYHYGDNLARSIKHTGRIMLEWIPKIYDTRRIARIIGDDGSIESANLNPDQPEPVADMVDDLGRPTGKSYNIGVGKYDVTVSTGPTFQTKRQEAARLMTESLQGNPQLMSIIGDLYYRVLDVPYADKIADRLKMGLPPNILEAEKAEGEGRQPPDPKVAAAMQQIEVATAQLEEKSTMLSQAEKEIQTAANEVSTEKAQLESLKKEIESARKILSAEQSEFNANAKATELQFELNVKNEAEKLEEQAQQGMIESEGLVQTHDSQIAQPMAALAQNMESIAQVIAQSNQIAAQNGDALARMMENNNAHRQYVSSAVEKLLNTSP